MSTPYPYYDPNEILSAMQNQTLNNSISHGTTKIMESIAGTNRNFTTEMNDVGKDVTQSALGLRDAIERGNSFNTNALNETNRYLTNQINNVGKDVTQSALGLRDAMERGNASNATAIERTAAVNGAAIERTAAVSQTAIERVAGEGRLTTTVVDAASRQAAADSARDIMRAVDHTGAAGVSATERNGSQLAVAIERNGANGVNATQMNATTLLGTVERIAGENRVQTLISAGVTDSKLTDVRHSILNDVNRSCNEIQTTGVQNFNVLNKAVTDSAWEQRTATAVGFQHLGEEHLRSKSELAMQASNNYSSALLETQKLGARSADHYSSLLLEQQKLKEYLSSKGDNQFAMTQLELQKVKEGLACQAANHFAVSQLEAQKNREAIQMQLADAKYEALKSQQYLTDKMGECCCEVKEKMDLIDRDRLRDNLIVSRDDNNLLKILELSGGLGYGRGGYDRGDRGDRGRR